MQPKTYLVPKIFSNVTRVTDHEQQEIDYCAINLRLMENDNPCGIKFASIHR